ncbi:MAG: hypothetical protein ACSHYA_10270 [Opitutaceae bacterium]
MIHFEPNLASHEARFFCSNCIDEDLLTHLNRPKVRIANCKRKIKIYLTTFLISSATAYCAPDASNWTQARNCHVPFEQKFAPKIRVSEEAQDLPSESVTLSENEVYWFYVEPYDENEFKQRIIFSGEGTLTITFDDAYPNFPIKVKWINEKLVFIRVWWGRILGTDMIFDVEKQEFLSREMVYDGTQLYSQTQQALGKEDSGSYINSAPQHSTP